MGASVAFGIPGRADVHRHRDSLARAQAIRPRAARAAESAFVSERLPHGARLRHARPRARDRGRGGGDRLVPAHAEVRFRHCGLQRAGGGDRFRRPRRVAATRSGARPTSRRSRRRRARGLARAGALLSRDAVLVALRPEGIDVGLAGGRDDEARAGSSRRKCRRSIRCSSCCSSRSTTSCFIRR